MFKQIDIQSKYCPIAVWAWNDYLEKERISEQIAHMCDQGFGGFAIMPWWQLPYTFVSDQYLDFVEFALGKAEE